MIQPPRSLQPWGRVRQWVDRTGGPTLAQLDMDEWHHEGLCRQHPAKWWLSDYSGHSDLAIAVCQVCPVRRLCLASALVYGDEWVIYGGTTREERLAMTRRLRRGDTLGDVLADALSSGESDGLGAA